MIKTQNLKPERDFRIDDNMTLDEVERRCKQNISITGYIHGFNIFERNAFVSLGNGIEAVLPFDEICLEELKYSSGTPAQLKALLRKKSVRAKVTSINGDKVYISRKANLLETLDIVKENIGCFFYATVESASGHSVFLDIGEGVIAYCGVEELTRIHLKDTRDWVKIGQHFRVKVTNFKEKEKFVFCSVKRGSFGDYSKFKKGTVVNARVGAEIPSINGSYPGFFVEITPAISGIADVCKSFYSGEKPKFGDMVKCYIREVDAYNHKMKLFLMD